MQHDDDVRAAAQRFAVTGFLVAAVAQILFVDEGSQAKFVGDLGGSVVAAVVHQNHFVDKVLGDLAISLFQRFRRVIRGHDHENAFTVQHK